MAQNLPAKIGKYEVLEVLGQGGMGTVYKGVDPLIGRLVAIKVIVANYIDNPELLKRFYREAKAVGNLQHPNIVTVYDLGEENKNPYLVMQYLDGEPLNKIIAARRELPLLQKLGIITQVCDALAYAHQRDIVHRDVKPANVMLLKDGQVKLFDFGIARLGNSGHWRTETQKGQVMGTMSYIAPEQLNEEIVDGRCDVYSTGVMLFELLTYRLPFEASDLGSLIAKKMAGGPPLSLSKYLKSYPPELDDIVGRALGRDRDERYSTAQDFASDLERLMERLKRDMVSHYVDRARACISSAELGQAKDILSEVLKIDTQHTAAKQLLYEVQQSLQKQQRAERIQQLRQHAEEAIAQKQFDDASSFVEQAIKLDRTDPELLNLGEQIQQAKQRAKQVKKLLHLAEVAQQSGELRMFQRALAEALELDPEDPQARVLQASLIRLQAEQEKKAQVQELLVAAGGEIAARKFEAAQECIQKAEALDPHFIDIPALKQMVLAGQEQETRKRQLQQLCNAIQQELEANNLKIARDLADKALRAFPGEPALLRMKSAAESQLEAEERRRFVEVRIAAASKLMDAGEFSRALSLIQEASRQFPTDTRLRNFLQTVRQAVQQSAVQREQTEMLALARAAMRQKRFAEAVEILEAGQLKYPDLRDIGDLLSLARKEQELLAQKRKVADVSEQVRTLVARQAFGDALSLLEKTVVYTPDPSLQKFLESVGAQAAEFDASLNALKQEAMALLGAGHPAEALMKLQSQAGKFGHSPGFKEFLQRVEEQITEKQESRQQVARVLAEARSYLQRGALREAEAALAECRAKAPQDAGVVAISLQLIEAKAASEHERKIQPPHTREVLPSPEPKTNAVAATFMFNPRTAVADLTPPVGIPVSPEDGDPGGSSAAASPVPARAEEQDAATRGEPAPIPFPTNLLEWLRKQLTPRRLVWGGTVAGLVLIALAVRHFWPNATRVQQSRTMALHVWTVPKGAKIFVDHEVRGTSDVRLDLSFGDHHLQASLSGYKDAGTSISLKPGSAGDAVLTLDPLPPQFRVASPDLDSAEVWLDNNSIGRLEEGSLRLPDLPAGHHIVRISVPPKGGRDVILSVDSTPGALPIVTPQLGTDQLQVVVVSSKTGELSMKGSIVPASVALDGNPAGQMGADGLEISRVDPGVHELAFEERNGTHKVSIEITPSPTIDAIVFSQQNVGTLLVVTGENNAKVFVDGHPNSRSTQNGQLRIPSLSVGRHAVRVAKDGFDDSPPQNVLIATGQEARLKFALVPKATPGPPVATLAISNGPHGSDVLLDGSPVGMFQANGSFSYASVAPGHHTVEIRKDGYQSIPVSRNFAPGSTVTINGSEITLLTGILEITFTFHGQVTLSRGVAGESPIYVTSGSLLNLQPGAYTIRASGAGNLTPKSVRVVAGEKQSVELLLQ